jgi:hypothetical protein
MAHQADDEGRPTADHLAVAAPAPAPANGATLLERLKTRRRELEEHQTELFGVPGYTGTLLVELGIVPYETLSKINARVQRETRQQPHLHELYTNAENIIVATEGFWELLPDGSVREAQGTDNTWQGFAHALNPDLANDARPRVCMINMVGDVGVALLAAEWIEWRRGERDVVERDLHRDFGSTG